MQVITYYSSVDFMLMSKRFIRLHMYSDWMRQTNKCYEHSDWVGWNNVTYSLIGFPPVLLSICVCWIHGDSLSSLYHGGDGWNQQRTVSKYWATVL